MISWILLVISIILTIVNSLWWLIAVFSLLVFKANKWYTYQSRPWRRIHFPAMRTYAAAAGVETADAVNDGRKFNIRNALINLLCMLHPDWNRETAEIFVDTAIEKCEKYTDENLIRNTFRQKNKNISEDKLNELMETITKSLNRTDNSWIVRMAIAEIIESQFSLEDRGEYLVACIKRQAF